MFFFETSTDIDFRVEGADALTFAADVLALKHAQGLHGVDRAAVESLERAGRPVRGDLPLPGKHLMLTSGGALSADRLLILGVVDLYAFNYAEIREFGHEVLKVLQVEAPGIRHVCLTLHGPGYGLDEAEAFRAEVAGLLDAISAGHYPRTLKRITIVEANPARAERLQRLLRDLTGAGSEDRSAEDRTAGLAASGLRALTSAGRGSAAKRHVFVAMPFAQEFDDLYHYGIQGGVNAAGYLCERADLAAFTGDVIAFVKDRISTADLVVADLSAANPNVYLEVGYAWGKGVPTVLIARDADELGFDVRGQRCLIYKNIRDLETRLKKELAALSGTPAPS
jgi:hypothetical protein